MLFAKLVANQVIGIVVGVEVLHRVVNVGRRTVFATRKHRSYRFGARQTHDPVRCQWVVFACSVRVVDLLKQKEGAAVLRVVARILAEARGACLETEGVVHALNRVGLAVAFSELVGAEQLVAIARFRHGVHVEYHVQRDTWPGQGRDCWSRVPELAFPHGAFIPEFSETGVCHLHLGFDVLDVRVGFHAVGVKGGAFGPFGFLELGMLGPERGLGCADLGLGFVPLLGDLGF